MADLETRLIATEKLLDRTRAKHKKEIDRLHRRIRQLENRQSEKVDYPTYIDCPTCKSMLNGKGT